MSEKGRVMLEEKKFHFMVPSVVFLVHKINSQGMHSLTKSAKATKDVPKPRNIIELKFYLGLLSYYSKFLPNLFTNLAPL